MTLGMEQKRVKKLQGDLKGKALATHFLIISNYPIKLFKYSSFPIIQSVYENIIKQIFLQYQHHSGRNYGKSGQT